MDIHRVLHGTSLVHAHASGTLLVSDTELSFWGGVHPKSSEVIDRSHPLSGRLIKDAVLAIPGGRGSCSGSATILELILNDVAPKALLFERPEQIVSLGVIVAEEIFDKAIPVVLMGAKSFSEVKQWDGQMVSVQDNIVSSGPLVDSHEQLPGGNGRGDYSDMKTNFNLSASDQEMLDGLHSEASRVALKIIIRVAQMMGATELMDVSAAHVDGAFFGPGALAFAKKLHAMGGKFCVPTTVNALMVDLRRWQALGVAIDYGMQSDELASIFLSMGASMSFTCAPYQQPESTPKQGDVVAWGESNAVAYANSVLGARTLKNANMLECLMALTGRAPKAGLLLGENRKAEVEIHVEACKEFDDSFWPLLGYCVGRISGKRIALVTGLETTKPLPDDLKAFGAAFGTSSSAPMFHILGITPEAPDREVVERTGQKMQQFTISRADLAERWHRFNNNATQPHQIDLISLGSPHFSCREIRSLAKLCHGKAKHTDVAIIVTCGRAQYSLAQQSGAIDVLEEFGVQFLTDTCWCFIEEPVIRKPTRVIMTNSGKYAHYGPGITGRGFRFGGLAQCVDAACRGHYDSALPFWLRC